MRTYENIHLDYDQFPVPDLTLDVHWIQLPTAVILERRRAQQQAEESALLAQLPENHKIILVPTDLHQSPTERELWPLINQTVKKCLEPHPALYSLIVEAIKRVLDEHRGWRTPFPQPV